MTNPKSTKQDAGSDAGKALVAKWGKASMAAGFTALPDVVFHQQKVLKLKPLDVLILLHLASYWWKPGSNPWPSKAKIADAVDVTPRTVQRSIEKMEKLGYVQRIMRKAAAGDNLSNEYDLSGLVQAASKLAEQKLALKGQRDSEDKSQREAPLSFALIKGGKKS